MSSDSAWTPQDKVRDERRTTGRRAGGTQASALAGRRAGFVVLTPLAVVVVPWAVQRRVDELREEIVASEPERTLLKPWALRFGSEITALRGLAGEHDPAYLDAYRTARFEGEAALRELVPLASQLGPDVIEAQDAAPLP